MKILIQCGDNLENTRRVLALAVLLRRAGHQPLAGVYTEDYAAPFQTMGIETIALGAFRPRLLALNPSRELGFSPDVQDLLPVATRAAELSGETGLERSKARSAIAHLVAAKRALDACGADALVVWNGVTGHFANAFRVMKEIRGLPGGFIERGLISDGLYFDRDGTNGWSSSAGGISLGSKAERAERRARHLEALHIHFPSLMRDAYLNRSKQERSKIIFVPLQVQSDSNILLHSQHIKTMRQLVIEAIALRARWFPDYEILVRPHPEEEQLEVLNLPRTEGLRITSKGDLNEILQTSDVTVTVNSTVGLEAALYGNLPIVCGDGIYANEPFVHRHTPRSRGDPLTKLSELRMMPEKPLEQVSDFMIGLLDRNLVQPLKQSVSEPEGLLKVLAPTESVEPPARAALLEQVRQTCAEVQGPIHCHVLASTVGPINLNYRQLRQNLRPSDIDQMLRAILELNKHFLAKQGAWSAQRHIAIADPEMSKDALSSYAAVFTPNFGLHPNFRQEAGFNSKTTD